MILPFYTYLPGNTGKLDYRAIRNSLVIGFVNRVGQQLTHIYDTAPVT